MIIHSSVKKKYHLPVLNQKYVTQFVISLNFVNTSYFLKTFLLEFASFSVSFVKIKPNFGLGSNF